MSYKFLRRSIIFIIPVLFCAFALLQITKFDLVTKAEPNLLPPVGATKAVGFPAGGDVDLDGRADPGDTLQYTVTITNGGTDATGVSINDTLQNITTLVGGSVVASPIAVNDSFSSIGNVGISVPMANGVFANDLNPNGSGTLTVQSVNQAGLQGLLSLNTTTGAFDFTPNPGFEGSTSFTYTLSNGTGLTDTATVTINVSGMIWFVNASLGVNGDGRLGAPFNSLANFNAGAADDPNDNIFLFESATGYSGGVTLLSGQKLIGQDATATLAAITGITVPSFSSPALPTMNSGNGTFTNLTGTTTLNTNTTLRGLRINSITNTGINDPAGAITGVSISEIATVTTTTGTAVSLSDFGGTVTLTSVSSNGAATGISLTNTTGSFTVTGNGGTCTAATPTCTGGTIANSTDSGVKLSNANNINLTRMRLNGSGNFGLSGSTVTVMNIDTCVFDGVHGNLVDEGALFVTNWLTSGTVSNSEILGGANDNMRVHNTGGVLNRLTISNSIIRNTNTVAPGNHGLRFATVLATGTGAGTVMNLTVTGSTFQNNKANHFDAGATGLSTMDLVLTGNTFVTNGGFTTLAGAVNTTVDHQADVTFDYNGNLMNGAQLSAFNFFSSNLTTAASSMIGKFRNNMIGTTGVVGSGSFQGNGVDFNMTGLMTLTANVTGNQIRQYLGNYGILVQGGDTSPVINATITGNTVKEGGPASFQAIHLNAGTTAAGSVTACVDIGGAGVLRNDVLGSGGAAEIRVRQRNSSVVQLPGLTGAVDAFLAGRNTVTGTSSVTFQGVFGNNGGASCSQAPLADSFGEIEASAIIGGDDSKSNIETEQTISKEPSLTKNNLLTLSETFSRIYNGLSEAISPTVFAEENTNISNAPFSGETVTKALGTIPANEQVVVRFNAIVDNGPFAAGVNNITNTASISGSNFGTFNSNTTSILLDAAPDLSVTKSDGATTTQPGGTVAYTLSYQNATGNNLQNATGVVLTETVPANTTFNAGASTAGWSCTPNNNAGSTCTLAVGALNAGANGSATFAVNVLGTLPAVSTVSNTSSIADDAANGTDLNGANNTGSDTTPIIGVWLGGTSTDWFAASNWSNSTIPPSGNNVAVPNVANQPIITTADVTLNNLVLNGENVTLNAGRTLTVNGAVTLGSNNIDGAGTLALGAAATITRTTGQVNSALNKTFAATGAFTYPMGTANGYSPVTVNITALGINPSSLQIRANQGTAPATPPLVDAMTINRYWTLTETGDLTADLTFNYLQTDVDGTETNYRTIRVTSGIAVGLPNGTPCPGAGNPCVDTTANTIFVGGVSGFSDWTAGEFAPTAANVEISGRVINESGRGVSNAVISMIDENGNIRLARTNPFGYFRFRDVATGENYVFNVKHKLYEFAPQVHTIDKGRGDLIFSPNNRR